MPADVAERARCVIGSFCDEATGGCRSSIHATIASRDYYNQGLSLQNVIVSSALMRLYLHLAGATLDCGACAVLGIMNLAAIQLHHPEQFAPNGVLEFVQGFDGTAAVAEWQTPVLRWGILLSVACIGGQLQCAAFLIILFHFILFLFF
jgi:hypothetical protein